MTGPPPILIRVSSGFFKVWLVFVAIGLVVAVIGHLRRRKRRETLALYAPGKGWQYVAEDNSLAGRFQGFPFGRGNGRRVRNVLLGNHDGRYMVAFDYQYVSTTGSTESRHSSTHYYSVLALHVGHPMPPLEVSPRSVVASFIGRLTGSDLEVGSPEFTRAFRVKADSPRFATDVLHPQMTQLLLTQPDVGWRFDGDSLVVVRKGQQSIEEVERTLAHMDAILDTVPASVWRAIRGQ